MEERRRGIILRASSEYKNSLTLLDERQGKIEGLVYNKRSLERLFHGAVISYSSKKNRSKHILLDIELVDMPVYWTGKHFLFFHHVLELSDYFLPWDAQATALFQLLHILYTDPEAVGTRHCQKVFLSHFFRRIGIYPEEDMLAKDIESWLRACVHAHPGATALRTAGFLKIMDLHEEVA